VGEDDARKLYTSGLSRVGLLEKVVFESEKGPAKGGRTVWRDLY